MTQSSNLITLNTLLNSFRNLTATEAAPMTATLEVTTLTALAKRTDVAQKIEARTNELRQLSDAANRRALLRVIAEISDTPYPDASEPDLNFLRGTLNTLCDTFDIKTKGIPEDQALRYLTDAVLQDLLSRLSESMNRSTTQQQEQVISNILDWYNNAETPEAHRVAFVEATQMSSVTRDALRAQLPHLAGVLGTYAVVTASGFGPYIAITVLTHAMMTSILGVTVPFAVYTTLTSLTAAVFNPLSLLVVGAVVLSSGLGKSSKELRRKCCAFVLAQIAFLPNDDHQDSA